jgi:hypothetical protein
MSARAELLAAIETGRTAAAFLAGAGTKEALETMIDDLGREALDAPAEEQVRTLVLKARREGLVLFKLTLEGLAVAGTEAEAALAALDGEGAPPRPGRLA